MLKEYRSQPLATLEQCKKLVRDFYLNISRAKEDGAFLCMGSTMTPTPILAGIPNLRFLLHEAYSGVAASNRSFSQECCETVEARGFGRDICSYVRMFWGSIFLDKWYFGGRFPRPDFFVTGNTCEAGHAKCHREAAEYFGVPFWAFEMPIGRFPEREQHEIEYLASELNDCIEWLEKITGKQFDEERFIEACYHYFDTLSLWGQIALLNRAIPAPVEFRSLSAAIPVNVLLPHTQAAVDAYRNLRDEIADRVANHIAAVPTEKYRLMMDNVPPWSAWEAIKYPQHRYGAVWVGVWLYLNNRSMVDFRPDGTVIARKTPQQQGLAIKNRDDALRALASWEARNLMYIPWKVQISKEDSQIAIARHWQVDGVVMHYNRGCIMSCLNIPCCKTAFEQAGIPAAVFEGNFGDARDVDPQKFVDTIDGLMERLGAR